MKQAGCKRIYFGVESASPDVLKYLDKELDIEKSLENLGECKKYSIETLGLFIVGAPVETESDFNKSIEFAIKADFDYIIVSALIPYPGTALFETLKDDIEFSILPYKNVWKNVEWSKISEYREREFYRRYYMRPRFAVKSVGKVVRKPAEFIRHSLKLAGFIYQPATSGKRADFI
jgi:radical SAM superfamily enzyme YgiQ (UPF0313 family)